MDSVEVPKQLCVIFDLDNTLIANCRHPGVGTITIEYYSQLHDALIKRHILKRPYADMLLNNVSKKYAIALWSVGQPEYVDAVRQQVFTDLSFRFTHNWTHCRRENQRITKRLSDLPLPTVSYFMVEDNPNNVEPSDTSKALILPAFEASTRNDVCLWHLSQWFQQQSSDALQSVTWSQLLEQTSVL